MEHCEQGVRVGPSLHGWGVFSTRSFLVHELLGPIRGRVIDDPQYESDYCMELGEHSALEPGTPFRFVNHSCQPNCRLLELEPDSADANIADGGDLWLEALCDIAPGEQLTIDYGWPAWAAIPCGCGSAECRGWIVAAAERQRIAPGRQSEPSPG